MATFSELVSGHENVYFTERFELIFNNLVSIRHISISDGDDICTNTHKSGLIEMVGQSAADMLQCSNTNSISHSNSPAVSRLVTTAILTTFSTYSCQ